MRNKKLAVLSVFALGSVVTQFAQGAVVYSYAASSPTYTGLVGSTAAVNIYLDETLTGASMSYIVANGGVVGAGAAVNGTSTTGGTAASIANASFTNAPGFANGSSVDYYNQGTGNNLEFTQTIPTTTKVGVSPTNSQVLLGTLNITIGSGTTTYSLTSLNNDVIDGGNSNLSGTLGNTVTELPAPLGSDLDAPSASYTGADLSPAFTFTVGPVSLPEPASLSLFGLGVFGLFRRRR